MRRMRHLITPEPCCLSPRQVVRSVLGRVPAQEVLGTRLFDEAALQLSPGWVAELNEWEAERAAAAQERQGDRSML
jgi:hypothetical protein